ncbi:F-box domain-containing protein [Mycena sanguinolenta]|uniref:F-box domain-containing protein n=1 Tax=Mycena sanguinolenta TaxID=230812 RepID=A0A8H7D2X7_9AGAR|nr:F-box domain-containing protein [Mycena sanguinolenta]
MASISSMNTILAQQTQRARGSSKTAPIHTLPVELLAEIFMLTIRKSDSNEVVRVLKDSLHVRAAFRIAHVCRHWRQIANGTPQVWTGPMHLDFRRRSDPEKDEIYVNGLGAWLTRSEPLSLPISIGAPPDRIWNTELGSRLTRELLRIASRCRSLRILHGAPCSLIQGLGDRLDSLEELELQSVVWDIPAFDLTTIISFTTAPRLQKLSTSRSQIPMPWAQLTDITLTCNTSPDILLHIFSQCTNVVRAFVVTAGWPVKADMLTLNRLQIFSVTWVENQVHYMRFLDCLSITALDQLRLSFHLDGDMGWAAAIFTAFQLRSPNITKLKIEGEGDGDGDGDSFHISPDAFIAALRHAPSLTHLSINDCLLLDTLLQALRHTDDTKPLVPRLHSLAFADLAPTLSEDDLASMIASRWWTDAELASRSKAPAVARWRQIRLRDDSDCWSGFAPSPKFRDTMEELRQTGLAVDLVESKSWWSEDGAPW